MRFFPLCSPKPVPRLLQKLQDHLPALHPIMPSSTSHAGLKPFLTPYLRGGVCQTPSRTKSEAQEGMGQILGQSHHCSGGFQKAPSSSPLDWRCQHLSKRAVSSAVSRLKRFQKCPEQPCHAGHPSSRTGWGTGGLQGDWIRRVASLNFPEPPERHGQLRKPSDHAG